MVPIEKLVSLIINASCRIALVNWLRWWDEVGEFVISR